MRYFLVAGEASGDNLGSGLIDAIRARDPAPVFAFWGGDGMTAAAGLSPKQHLRDLAFMGFVEVVANLRTIRRLERDVREDVLGFAPDSLVLIDYPGFNLRLAGWAKARGIRVEFFVSPQIWAWRPSRVHRIMASVDRLLCILPFEPEFYAGYGYDVTYVGHPLPRRVDRHPRPRQLELRGTDRPHDPGTDRVLALLPGSRTQEIRALLTVMLAGAERFCGSAPPDERWRIVIAAAAVLPDADLVALAERHGVAWVRSAYDLLSHAGLACVASGSATLETALFDVPQVVCYRGNAVSVAIARRLVRVEYIALPNLILDEPVVPELIQRELTPPTLAGQLLALRAGPPRARIRAAYARLRERLAPYHATARAAGYIVASARPSGGR